MCVVIVILRKLIFSLLRTDPWKSCWKLFSFWKQVWSLCQSLYEEIAGKSNDINGLKTQKDVSEQMPDFKSGIIRIDNCFCRYVISMSHAVNSQHWSHWRGRMGETNNRSREGSRIIPEFFERQGERKRGKPLANLLKSKSQNVYLSFLFQ